MAEPGGTAWGEVAGIITAAAGGLFGIGKGIQWLLDWIARRAESRAAKLQIWHDELSARERSFDEKVEQRLAQLEARDVQRQRENNALRLAFEIVAAELRAKDPRNPALLRAEKLLEIAFPLDPLTPAAMSAQLGAIDRIDEITNP